MSQQLASNKSRVVSVVRAAGDVIHIDDVVKTLSVNRSDAAKLLSRWTHQGWLRRVGRGKYVAASLESLDREQVLEDPWVLVPALYAPAYIGGRTAAEYWDLTEQLFRDIVVMTAQPVRQKLQVRHGVRFALRHIQAQTIFGVKPVWRGQSKIQVSDVNRTLIDMLDVPALGGGIQHVADCFTVWLQHADRSDPKLLEYAAQLGNGAVYKRLGFLAEQHTGTTALVKACGSRLSKGNSQLDPGFAGSRLITRWRLWVPETWAADA